MKVAVLSSWFMSWGGGIDFLRLCVNALYIRSGNRDIEIHLLIPHRGDWLSPIKDIRRSALSCLRETIVGKPLELPDAQSFEQMKFGDTFENLKGNIKVEVYENCRRGLISKLRSIQADVILPAANSLGRSFPIPWIGYIYDYQHKYYPNFFKKEEIVKRDRSFQDILCNAKAVIVNSKTVKQDIQKFHPGVKCKLFNLPFAPVVNPDCLESSGLEVKSKYNLPNLFFIMSNQFWVHKSHVTAFEALAILKEENPEIPSIVCTGNTEDYRFPRYFDQLKARIKELNLESHVKILGYIPKRDQVQILRNAIAVLQPTLFEGGPGGGAVYEAVAYGIPAVVSDIPVNLEIQGEDIVFFKAGSAQEMAFRMQEIASKSRVAIENPVLLQRGENRLHNLGSRLFEAIDYVVETHG